MKGAPVIYTNKENIMSMLLTKTFVTLNTLDSAVAMFAKTKATISKDNFHDLFSFFEISDHRHEYEWRIVSGHKFLGGSKVFPIRNRLLFSKEDVVAIYIPNDKNIDEFKQQLNSLGWGDFEKIFSVRDILLTEENHKEIDAIRKIKYI